MSSLYSFVFKLYKKESVDLTVLKKKEATCIKDHIYNAAISLIKDFHDLLNTHRSHLNVLLSSCINVVNHESRIFLLKYVPQTCLSDLTVPDRNYKSYNDLEWSCIKAALIKEHQIRGKRGLRVFICKRKAEIYSTVNDYQTCFELMVFDIMEHILNMIEYTDWTNDNLITEQNFALYWKPIMEMLFRGSCINVTGGESTSDATKFDRILNETEFGDLKDNLMGRRIDLRSVFYLINDSNCKQMAELGSIEIKQASTDKATELIQLDKNIRINKSILGSLYRYGGSRFDVEPVALGLDIIGLTGILYSLKPSHDIILVNRVAEEPITLPFDELDLKDFLQGSSLDQLLNYMLHHKNLANAVIMASRRFKRERRINPHYADKLPFADSTFFTPKRPNSKATPKNQ